MKKTPVILFLAILLVSLSVSAVEKITVDEGTLIKLNVDATDPDGDELEYIFPEPFNEEGQWQTNYTSAGEYIVKLAVSDGEALTYRNIIIKINDKDRAPEFKNLKSSYEIKENKRLKIELEAVDPDGDSVTYEAVNLPEGASFDGDELSWKPDYDVVMWEDSWQSTLLKKSRVDRIFSPRTKTFTVRFIAKGKELETAQDVKIKVRNVNRRPSLDKLDDLTVYEGEAIILEPTATDPDGDRLTFTYSGSMNTADYVTTLDDEGEYEVKVRVSDGELSDSLIVKIKIKNTNRAPELEALKKSYSVNENRTLTIELKGSDPDGDDLTYVSKEQLPNGSVIDGNKFIWTPNFDAAGEYNITFAVKDARLDAKQSTIVKVMNVNRKPVINLSEGEAFSMLTGDTVSFNLAAFDPDGDNITYEWKFGLLDSYSGGSEHTRTFTVPGEKKVRAVVSDGEFEVEKIWNITVNERPVAVQPEPAPVPTPTPQPQPAEYFTFTIE